MYFQSVDLQQGEKNCAESAMLVWGIRVLPPEVQFYQPRPAKRACRLASFKTGTASKTEVDGKGRILVKIDIRLR